MPAVQQPRQRGGLHLLHVAPHNVLAVLGAGERHVQQAQFFGQDLAAGGVARGVADQLAGGQPRLAAVTVAPEGGIAPLQRAIPQEGAEHQRVLQAFRGVDGDDLYQLGVAFQPQQRFLASGRAGHGGLEPRQQRGLAGDALGFLLQQLGQVAQVGQAAFAVRQRQQARGHALARHEATPGGHEAALLPLLVVVVVGHQSRFPRRLVLGQLQQLRRVQPQQRGGGQHFQPRFGRGLGPGAQQGQQLGGLVAGKYAFLRQRYCLHAACGQGIAHRVALTVGGHQHRHIATGQRAAATALFQLRFVLAGQRQQAGDLVGGGFGGVLRGLGLVHAFIAIAGGKGQHGERAVVVGYVQGAAAAGRGVYLRVVDAVQQKRLRPVEQLAHCRHQRRLAAAVGQQGVLLVGRGVVARAQVGKNVGTAKAVNGLFGVAHHEHRPRLLHKGAAEDAVLQRVGILEFVDQRNGKVGGDACGQPGAVLGVVQCAGQVGKQVVKATAARGAALRHGVLVYPRDHGQLEPGDILRQLAAVAVPRGQPAVHQGKQPVLRRAVALVHALVQLALPQARQLFGLRGR